jgi:hypothetical protein
VVRSTFTVEIDGQYEQAVCTIQMNARTLFRGYVDDLVTSASGELLLNLNFGQYGINYPVRVKAMGEYALLIPVTLDPRSDEGQPLVIALSDMVTLWTRLGYDPEPDLSALIPITSADLKFLWLIASRIPNEVGYPWNRTIERAVLALDTDDPLEVDLFQHLLILDWSPVQPWHLVRFPERWRSITAFFNTHEWDALRVGPGGEYYVSLGDHWGLLTPAVQT